MKPALTNEQLNTMFQDPKVALVALDDAALIAALAAKTTDEVLGLLRSRDGETLVARALVAFAKALDS
jgi:hypothetical protein